MQEKNELKIIGTYCLCNVGGLVIFSDLCEEYATSAFYTFDKESGRRRTKIHTTPAGRYYIRRYGVRYYLDEIERV